MKITFIYFLNFVVPEAIGVGHFNY